MIGPNANGEWVDFTNKCSCGWLMPLPQSQGKSCPKCGTRVLNCGMQTGLGVNTLKCPSCEATVKVGDKFCTECGAAIPERPCNCGHPRDWHDEDGPCDECRCLKFATISFSPVPNIPNVQNGGR